MMCMAWFHAKRLRLWQDRLADRTYHLDQWGFGMTPSERRKEKERIAKAKAMVKRLTKAD